MGKNMSGRKVKLDSEAEHQVKGRADKVQQQVKPETMQDKLAKMKIWQLVAALVLVVTGVVLFVGAVGGWFSGGKVVLDAEYYCTDCDGELIGLIGEEYEQLVSEKKSFVVLVDQGGCTTAERLKEYMKDYAKDKGIIAYRMMFADVKKGSLHEYVKYYPSVVVVSNGRVRGYLRADSDDDAKMYNDYEAFRRWMERYL